MTSASTDGIRVAQGLDAELVVLAEAAGLRPLVPEHGAEVVHAHGLRQIVHAVLQVGAADRRCSFGPQGNAVTATVLEGVHLLFDDIGTLAHGPDEEIGVFEGGGVDAPVAEQVGNPHGFGLNVTPVFLFVGQVVGGSARRSKDHSCYSVEVRNLD